MLSYTTRNVKIAVTCDCGRTVPSRQSVNFSISKMILYFLYWFYVPYADFSLCTFTLYFPFFVFFVVDCTQNQKQLIKPSNFALIKDWLSVSRSNVQAVRVENKEQYTSSNIIHIKFQKFCFFLWGLFESSFFLT